MPGEEVSQGANKRAAPPPSLPLVIPVATAGPARPDFPDAAPPGNPLPGLCANCTAPLAGPFCAHCGQHVADYHRSVWKLVANFFDNAFCWDNKLFRTLGPLVARPGWLVQEFMAGRRVRYVHPLRLFLFASAVCLTLLQYGHQHLRVVTVKGPHGWEYKADFAGKDDPVGDTKAAPDASPAASPASSTSPAPPALPASGVPPDTASAAAVPTASPGPAAEQDAGNLGQDLRRIITEATRDRHGAGKDKDKELDKAVESFTNRMGKKVAADGGPEKFVEHVIQDVQQRLSWVTLAILPIFALLLRSLYWRRDSFYFAHLIFSLHYHTFLLMFWTAYTWMDKVVESTHFGLFKFAASLCLLVPPWYLYVALRRLYGDSRKRTLTKVVVLGALHLLALVVGLSIVGALSFMKSLQG